MSKLDLEWLAVFDQVYETRSVSRAAENLGIAQATASIALNKLRLHFDDRLFSRTPAGMQPTSFAMELRPSLRKVTEILAQSQKSHSAFAPGRSTRSFRLCMTDIRQVVMLPRLVNHLRQVAPGIRLEVQAIDEHSPRLMEEGQLELAVGYMPQLDTGFFQRTLFDEDFVCLVSVDHPRIGRLANGSGRTRDKVKSKTESPLTRAAFLAEGQVFVTMSGTGPSIVEKTLAAKRLKPDVALRVPSFLGVARIVAATEFLVVVPRSLGEAFADQDRVKVLAAPIDFPAYSVRLHWHERVHADPGNVWLRQQIAELFARERTLKP